MGTTGPLVPPDDPVAERAGIGVREDWVPG